MGRKNVFQSERTRGSETLTFQILATKFGNGLVWPKKTSSEEVTGDLICREERTKSCIA